MKAQPLPLARIIVCFVLALVMFSAAECPSVPRTSHRRALPRPWWRVGLASPTAMQFAPDGRLFVAEQVGRLRVIENGYCCLTPFLTVTVSSSGERGLLA